MDWPSRSTDLNITEAGWDHLDNKQHKRQPMFKEELGNVIDYS